MSLTRRRTNQICQVEDINLVREENTGKSRGFCFLKYEDARSCVLAVDNLTGSKVCTGRLRIFFCLHFSHQHSFQILGRSIRVDHVEKYRLPKHLLEKEEAIRTDPGHAYEGKQLASEFRLDQGQDLFARPPPPPQQDEAERGPSQQERKEAKRKRKEERESKRRKKEARREEREERKRLERAKKYRDGEDSSNDSEERRRKKKKKKHRRKRSRSRSPSPVAKRRDGRGFQV